MGCEESESCPEIAYYVGLQSFKSAGKQLLILLSNLINRLDSIWTLGVFS
jgi:hypothetical protein